MPVFAQTAPAAPWSLYDALRPLEMSLLFSVLGLAIFAFAFWGIVRITPFSVRKEIEEDQNVALAIIIAAAILGIAWIIAAAIQG